MGSLTYILRDENTAIGIPGQAVTIRRGPAFVVDADTHTFTDVIGKPGAYKITDSSGIRTGFYKGYVNGVEDESFGGPNGREILRGSDLLMKSGGTMTGTIDMNNQRVLNLPLPLNENEPVTLLLFLAYACQVTGFTMEGDVDMDGYDLLVAPTPANANSATSKTWVLNQIASILAIPFQLGSRSRRVIAGGTEVPGRDYLTVSAALASISGISADARFKIYLEQGYANNGNDAHLDNVFQISEDELVDYITFVGYGKNTVVLLSTATGALTKNVTFENCTVYLTGNDFTTQRTYNGLTFNVCNIYAWKATKYNNCNMNRSNVFNANGFSPTLGGSGIYLFCGFCQEILEDTFTGTRPGTQGGWLPNPTMPIDPSVAV